MPFEKWQAQGHDYAFVGKRELPLELTRGGQKLDLAEVVLESA